ncbi:MAG: hypothetical protein SO111_03720 [Collinsella sp.]|nr:hypothetical protein [Collinsella sp.]
MQLALRILGIHKALALYPDIKIEIIDAGERNAVADGHGIGAQIAERASTQASSQAEATAINLGAYL